MASNEYSLVKVMVKDLSGTEHTVTCVGSTDFDTITRYILTVTLREKYQGSRESVFINFLYKGQRVETRFKYKRLMDLPDFDTFDTTVHGLKLVMYI